MSKKFIKFLLPQVALAGLALSVLTGCGDGAPSKAPPRTAPPFKKWKELSQEEKIKVIEKEPVPNKQEMIQRIREGKE
jgi:hypothetical protein